MTKTPKVAKSPIDTLLAAAAYIERHERRERGQYKGDADYFGRSAVEVLSAEAEHGYASTSRFPDDLKHISKRPKTKKSQGNRTSHNELEKNRRAHLRHCLEKLKEMVPLGPEAPKHTTLGLLTKAKRFIKTLEEKERKQSTYKEKLSREHRFLKRRLKKLSIHYDPSKRRSVSECSSSTVSSRHSTTSLSSAPSPISESDEVDVIGYTSTQSDTDDHSSVQSASSDSGVAMSTSRLTLSEMF